MSLFDDWARGVIQSIKKGSDLASQLIKHMGELGSERETLIRDVLSKILPSAYEIGKGQIVDSKGTYSKQIDVVIARKDSPCLRFASGYSVYLVESVLATIEVKSELNSQTLSDALDNCASVGELEPRVEEESYRTLLAKRGIKESKDRVLSHPKQLELERFGVSVRPSTYIFGFRGYPTDLEAFKLAIQNWGNKRTAKEKPFNMYHLPAVIASENCFALRNAEPFHKPADREAPDCLLYVGNEETPLRLLIAHLLYTIQTKIPWVPDANGLKSDPFVYIKSMGSFGYSGTVFCTAAEAARAQEEGAPVQDTSPPAK